MRKKEFEDWLEKKEGKSSITASSYKSSINKISKHYSQQNSENIDLYTIDDISFIRSLVKDYGTDGKYKVFGQMGNGTVRAAISAYARFIEDKPNHKNSKVSNKQHIEKDSHLNNPHEIVNRAMEKIKEINRECKNHNRESIFKGSVDEYSKEILESITSLSQYKDLTYYLYKIIFKDFILNLYIIIYETTREETSNTKGKPFYDYKLPDEFIKHSTTTRHFMDIVGTLRHYYAHLKPEYKEIKKISSHKDVFGELLDPESREDFQKLQIKVLERFETSMEKLLEIVKSKLNPQKPH